MIRSARNSVLIRGGPEGKKSTEMRFAAVGSGIPGLVVARLLYRGHDITVLEANAYPGGHTNTIRVDTPNETHQVDAGFSVLNDRNYPNFERPAIARRRTSTAAFR